MAQFVIENFGNGLDLRRSHDTAPSGSLRVLRNAFINEGGEVEKRKAFVKNADLTAYAQTANYVGRVTGPHANPTIPDSVFFRHRHNSLPSSGWTAGSGSLAVERQVGGIQVWAMKSSAAMTGYGWMYRAQAVGEFGDFSHIIEAFSVATSSAVDFQHFEIAFTGDEPTAETLITANNNRNDILILKQKAYFAGNTLFAASAVSDPGDMVGTGSGLVDIRTQSGSIGLTFALGEYYGQLVVFGTRGIQFWEVDPDFDLNQYLRTISGGVYGHRSPQGYGDGDLLYLARSGLRSLQARDSSNIAKVSDVGSPVDTEIAAALSLGVASETTDGVLRDTGSDLAFTAKADIHESSGQYWLFLREKVYVLSRHPNAKVTAWSTFDLPVPTSPSVRNGAIKSRWIADSCPVSETLMLRNYADEVFIYGGANGITYDASEVEIVTPHMDMGSPSTAKDFTGIDIACTGTWKVEVSVDPQNIVWEHIADITNSTHRINGRIPIDFNASHIAVRLTSVTAAAAKVGQITLLYNGGAEK